ncbi:MAG: DEAD/DEAH box helicase [Nitrospira sp.]
MANAATIEVARGIRHSLAGSALTGRQAKLYSQRLRRDMGRDGLASFLPGDVDAFLDEAMLLLHCGLLERRDNRSSAWRDAIKRAAEILEWLSQSSLKPPEAPLHLLAAAAYQLADYPAMALGHLRHVPDNQPVSVMLRELLRADFPAALKAVHDFWLKQLALGGTDPTAPLDLTIDTFKHVVMCLGTICTYLRTGDGMTDRALVKLEKLAASLLHSHDPYSYLLAMLTATSCRQFVETCLWPQVERLSEGSTSAAREAFIQFARSAFVNRRALIWPAQAAGIERLPENSSFVLCTPTGSGKTTVATLAVVQGLFAAPPENSLDLSEFGLGNLVLYIVPSRALAAEVEGRLAQDLKGIGAAPIVVTGLYGGVDWGPTDAWIQTGTATIVICTFEKADALMRYLGVFFLARVRLVVIDEAHMVEQDRVRVGGLEDGSSRAFRLEQLGARLLRARNNYGFRVLALSAVAARAAPALARWISNSPHAVPTTSSYRSTRQMLGRLEVSAGGQYTIRYDLMDGRSLKFDDERPDDTPFVRSPFPPLPGGINGEEGPEVRMRAPTLWAALQLAAERQDGSKPSVLISLTQNVEAFSATCADLMDRWSENELPNYRALDETNDLWVRCLASAEDYFTVQSIEYRLLRRGVAVHHGKMPGLLARRLKAVIDQGLVRIIIATSTLSEGVNIPVSFLLIPSVCRGSAVMSLQEFTNLIGRAGRPGVSSEGSALVVLPERLVTRNPKGRPRLTSSRQWKGYEGLVAGIEETTMASRDGAPEDAASSPLAHLLRALEAAWVQLTGGGTHEHFMTWLERTAVIGDDGEAGLAYRYLDTLDSFLIAAIQEVEDLQLAELATEQLEAELTAIWRRTYAFASVHEEERLAEIWFARGRVIKAHYPEATQRRRIYKTSLSPRSARSLLDLVDTARATLESGAGYSRWTSEQRFTFIRDVVALLSQVPSFKISTTLGRRRNFHDWPRLLRWWLAKPSLSVLPVPGEITTWYEFVAQNFVYRSAWGLGSLIGLLLDAGQGERPIRALEISDWPRSGLPWIAFWMKELITWGTLDPVAAFLLARGDAIDRPRAEELARSYYDSFPEGADPNEVLDPRTVRDWVDVRRIPPEESRTVRELFIASDLVRPVSEYQQSRLMVSPLEHEDRLSWIDSAGYIVAQSEKPVDWPDNFSTFEFELNVPDRRIVGNPYLRYAQQ